MVTAYALRYVTGPFKGKYAVRPALMAQATADADEYPALWSWSGRAEYWMDRINKDVVGSEGTVELVTFHCEEQ